MEPQQSTRELAEELNKHRIEISKLRNALNDIDTEKELRFKKKQELSAKIKDAIQKIRDSKAKRDSLTLEVKGLKQKRDSINKELSLKSSELEKLKKERSELAKSLDVKDSPSRIKQQMERLEFKIETDTVSFEKEKELMKSIRGLKKSYDKASILEESNKKIKDAMGIVRQMKRDANEAHKAVQEKAKQSQALHEEILKISAEIDKAKSKEEEAFKKFSEFKNNFNAANAQLKEKLKSMNEVKSRLDRIASERKERKMAVQESFLKSKEDAVNEKIKRREKLTTEDLLVFQKFEKG